LFVGAITAYIGYDNLRERLKMDRHQVRVESLLAGIEARVGSLGNNEEILRRYEQALKTSNMRDATLEAVLAQYARQRIAADQFRKLSGKSGSEETRGLSEEILKILSEDVYPVRVDARLPGQPLIIRVARNAFRVLFAAPMRVQPRLEFNGLPKGTTPEIQALSRFGFTVVFYPATVSIENFGFTADAEL
jgi:hypothetical protein